MHILHRTLIIVVLLANALPSVTVAEEVPQTPSTATGPYAQDFVVTAYYSPLPDQCCYIMGSYQADKIMNGEGTHAADGTPVYPGMIAAPKTYPFGTRIDLPGLGVLVVHDRGGAIQEWDDTHRLDIWVGHGEEGLARALAFGVQRVSGTIYPNGTVEIEPTIDLSILQAPLSIIQPYKVDKEEIGDNSNEQTASATFVETPVQNTEEELPLITLLPSYGHSSESVSTLQKQLSVLGYFHHVVTGYYGDVTASSVSSFLAVFGLTEPAERLTATSIAYLQAALTIEKAESPVSQVHADTAPVDIQKAQRILRHLGYYRGRTDGLYSTRLVDAIIAFQVDHKLVGDASSPGAGRIGPLTQAAIVKEINASRTKTLAEKWVESVAIAMEQGMQLL